MTKATYRRKRLTWDSWSRGLESITIKVAGRQAGRQDTIRTVSSVIMLGQASEKSHWVKLPASKADTLSLTPGTHMVEREMTPINCPLISTVTLWHERVHVDMCVCYITYMCVAYNIYVVFIILKQCWEIWVLTGRRLKADPSASSYT